MVTKTGQPIECQAKVGDSEVFSRRIVIPPLETWVKRYRREINREDKKCLPLEGQASPQFLVRNVLH